MDDSRLSIEQLADATETGVDDLRHWQALGLLRDSESHPVIDIERVRLIRFVRQRGLDPESIAKASRTQGDMLGHYVRMITAGRTRRGRPLQDVAQATGLDPPLLDRLWAAAGLRDQAEAYEEDVAAVGRLRSALDAGLPEDALAQIVRVFADSLGRVAEAEARLFHYYVHEQLRADGLSGPELFDASERVGHRLEGLIEPALLYFHRKAYQRALREDLLLHLAEDAPPSDIVGEIQATILFVDLSGFTPLTEAMGDVAAASLMERFSDLVRRAAAHCYGRVVKQIGDEFMLAFTDPGAALTCGLDIDAAAGAESQFPALRLGAHSGSVLYREGDYVGATVNIAARVTAKAHRHQFLITETLLSAAERIPEAEVRPVGAHELRGVAGSVGLFEIRQVTTRRTRIVDPVCLMELDSDGVATELILHGREFHFCSDECLKRFVAAPETYEPDGEPSR